MGHVIGIDLGTTYSAIAYVNADGKSEIIPNSEGERITPSVVFFEDSNIVVGSYAKSVAVSEGERVVQFIKRRMGSDYRIRQNDRDYTPEEISALILKKLKQDAESFLNTTIRDVVITVPAYFDDKRRTATKTAGEIAGLNVLRIINEPTASALEFSASREVHNKTILVYDLGGGTFDITIMKVNGKDVDVIASGGDHELGGKDIDDCLIGLFQEEFKKATGFDPLSSIAGQQELRSKAEETKRKLSSSPNVRIALNVEGRSATFKVTQNQFEELIDEIVLRTEMNIELVLEEAGLAAQDIDDVLLVGGSTRIPLVGKMLLRLFGKEPLRSVNPDEVVAQGAAILAITLSTESGEGSPSPSNTVLPTISDVCAHSLGVVIVNDFGVEENSTIIPKNSKIPCQASEVYGTASDNQSSINIRIVQGDAKDPDDCVSLGEAYLENFPPSPAGSPVRIIFLYDENGILDVTGVFVQTGQTVKTRIEVQGTMSSDAARRSRQELQSLNVE
ncbi:Hsp70 family protein [Coleofasciculus sp. FACHB-SPT9]|uniref:Hsp70 family protein n=1 Tax=Cyanophyceae TaxID=3028117 RepID=UPI00168863C9|nr:Hsp70 family protein [Coleofasciculus sp. FACHB-SPT9]MBD1892963.1 Hsp70 family protein [Coleofasciculus sp. FACHB-SPT9]